jgi:P27 family predicted phage terminase small subunit
MVVGRKPKPTRLKVVAGTARPDRMNIREPSPGRSMPAAPAFLSEEALARWNDIAPKLHRAGILTIVDDAVLAAHCQAWGRWKQAESALARAAEIDPLGKGLMIKTQSGNLIQNPIVGTANKAMADMVRTAVELGMSPSARSRVQAQKEGNETDPLEDLLAG